MTSNEATETTLTPAIMEPEATRKAAAGARRVSVASKKPKSGKKATLPNKAPTGAKKAAGARDGSKAAKILDLLRRPGGVTRRHSAKAFSKLIQWRELVELARLPVTE
jgi:hypothetical protein